VFFSKIYSPPLSEKESPCTARRPALPVSPTTLLVKFLLLDKPRISRQESTEGLLPPSPQRFFSPQGARGF